MSATCPSCLRAVLGHTSKYLALPLTVDLRAYGHGGGVDFIRRPPPATLRVWFNPCALSLPIIIISHHMYCTKTGHNYYASAHP